MTLVARICKLCVVNRDFHKFYQEDTYGKYILYFGKRTHFFR